MHKHWFSIRPTDGVLTGKVQDGTESQMRKLRIDLRYPDAVGMIDIGVHNSPQTHWQSRTTKVVNRMNEVYVTNSALWKNLVVILQERMHKIYDFDLRVPKGDRFGEWLQCMEQLLRMLRSFPTANLVKDSDREILPHKECSGQRVGRVNQSHWVPKSFEILPVD